MTADAGAGLRHQMSSSARLPFSSIQARRCEDSPCPSACRTCAWCLPATGRHSPPAAGGACPDSWWFPRAARGSFRPGPEAADRPGAFAHAFLAQLVLRGFQLAVVQAVDLARRTLALRRHVQAEQRRLGDVTLPASTSLGSACRTASATAPGCASRRRPRPTGCRCGRSAARTGRACRSARAGRRRWPPRCHGFRCWRTGDRGPLPRN